MCLPDRATPPGQLLDGFPIIPALRGGDLGTECRRRGSSCPGDAVSGNPISYYNGTRWTFGWEDGRKLVSASSTGNTISYGYDLNGVRDSKTVNSVEHTYFYASGKLLRETYGTNTLDFIYDSNGNPYALKYNGTTYYYITNLQGDVMYMVDANGATVATYLYDPYGKITTSYGAMAEINPLRYRGYYYDSETGFYYLQSRYYDPVIGRFINADDPSLLGANSDFNSLNLFAYCGNNPVARADVGGGCWHIVIGAIVGGVVSAVTTAIQTYKETGSVDITKTLISGAVGAVGGAVAATGWGMLTQAAVTAGATLLGDAATQVYEIATEQRKEYDIGRTIQNTVVAAGSSLLGSALGEITSGIRKINGKNLIEKGMGKIAQSKANQMVGKSFSNIYKKGIALIREGTKQVHIAQGTSSVTGTILTWGVSQRFSAS